MEIHEDADMIEVLWRLALRQELVRMMSAIDTHFSKDYDQQWDAEFCRSGN